MSIMCFNVYVMFYIRDYFNVNFFCFSDPKTRQVIQRKYKSQMVRMVTLYIGINNRVMYFFFFFFF